MYNRYVPQPDGSYRRNRIQDPQRPTSPPVQQPSPPISDSGVHTMERPCIAGHNPPFGNGNNPAQRKQKMSPPVSAGSFLRQLLPGDFDMEDLLVVVLLLLMAGDREDDRNSALLTLALYLFL